MWKSSCNEAQIFLVLLFCAYFLGCNSNFQSQSFVSKPNLPNDESVHSEASRACYLNNCFSTISANNIITTNEDYTYPNPENYTGSAPRSQYRAPSFLLDLNAIAEDTPVSKDFLLSDFMRSQNGRYAVFSSEVIKHMQAMREFLGKVIYITSGYRSPGHNSRVPDAAVWSRHTYGDAVDFAIPGVKPEDLVTVCRDQFHSYFQQTYPNHIHCDWRTNQLDPIFYGAGVDLPGTLPITKLSPTMYKYSLAQKSEIIMTHDGSFRTLSVQLPTEEGEDEEGTPTHKWSVVLPNNTFLESDEGKIRIPILSGEHKIKIVVGSTIDIERVVVW